MRPKSKHKLLILTSSFPATASDETCGYIREFAQSLAPGFQTVVLAPDDLGAGNEDYKEFRLVRS
ncbi:MAG TPA: hypothetical protein VJX67_16545, partial [Blastocatellia bacterium]|nr:hypothetical protein [Blastocatellia bacterium]